MLCLIPLIYLIQKWNSHQKHPKTICFVANSYKRPNKCHGVWKKASPMAGPFAGNAPFLLTSMERHMIMPERCNMCFQVCVRKMKPSSFHFRAQWFHKVYICLHAFDPISTKVHAIGTYTYIYYIYISCIFSDVFGHQVAWHLGWRISGSCGQSFATEVGRNGTRPDWSNISGDGGMILWWLCMYRPGGGDDPTYLYL